jgi:lipopolysaccharide transport system ATP-binding protein
MSDTVIRVDGLGKRFVIGHRAKNDGLFVDAMADAARRFLRMGKSALKGNPGDPGDVFEEFWALRDINFEIKRGELVSIIGHNGAGKSTLLKILSRITEPTTGRIEIDGRVTSLLEVGTGFHPELTGRENIFLNGAILGMTRVEVRNRFDEIVAFAGIEKFIDTPVKRYSIGMYARLAFAVAAHLEAEILVIDEVLAVGDAEFQQRCLNRMSTVASSGRTVLFVSHNLAAVSALTRRAIVLRSGKLIFDGPVQSALALYTSNAAGAAQPQNWGRGSDATLVSAELLDDQGNRTDVLESGSSVRVRVVVDTTGMPGMCIELRVRDELGLPVAFYSTGTFSQVNLPTVTGRFECVIVLAPLLLAAGQYSIDLESAHTNVHTDHRVESALRFVVDRCSPDNGSFNFRQAQGSGSLAMTLKEPIEFKPLAADATG